jgi:hypothetical protein
MVPMLRQDHRLAAFGVGLRVGTLERGMADHVGAAMDGHDREELARLVHREQALGMIDLGVDVVRAVHAGGQFGNGGGVCRSQAADFVVSGFHVVSGFRMFSRFHVFTRCHVNPRFEE